MYNLQELDGGKYALFFHEVFIWNEVLILGMDPVINEYEFSKSLNNYPLQKIL